MNSSQLILLFASFVILSTSILLVNRTTLDTENEMLSEKNKFIAISEARNLFEEIKSKIYDEKVTSMVNLIRDSLTWPTKFGPENETYPLYDDIDDYHNFIKNLFINHNAYTLRVIVNYVNENNPSLVSSTPTYFKLVRIYCLNRNQTQLFELKQIFSIW